MPDNTQPVPYTISNSLVSNTADLTFDVSPASTVARSEAFLAAAEKVSSPLEKAIFKTMAMEALDPCSSISGAESATSKLTALDSIQVNSKIVPAVKKIPPAFSKLAASATIIPTSIAHINQSNVPVPTLSGSALLQAETHSPKFQDAITRSINLGPNLGQFTLAYVIWQTLNHEIKSGKISYDGAIGNLSEKSLNWGRANRNMAIVMAATTLVVCAARQLYLGSQISDKKPGEAKKKANAEFAATMLSGLSLLWVAPAVKASTGKIPRAGMFLIGYAASYLTDAAIYMGIRKAQSSDKSNAELWKETTNAATLGFVGGLGSMIVQMGLWHKFNGVLSKMKTENLTTFNLFNHNFSFSKMRQERNWAIAGAILMLGTAFAKIHVAKGRTNETGTDIEHRNSYRSATAGLAAATTVFFFAVTKGRVDALTKYFRPDRISYMKGLISKFGKPLAGIKHTTATSPTFRSYVVGAVSSMFAGIAADYGMRMFLHTETENKDLPIAIATKYSGL